MASPTVPAHIPAALVYDFDIYKDGRIASGPHEGYFQLRSAVCAPLFYTPANGGHWVILDQQLMAEVVRDTEHFSSRQLRIPAVENPPFFIPLSLDPPANIPYRQLLNPFFSQRAVASMGSELSAFAADLVDSVAARGECDFVSEVAARFPINIFIRLIGLAPEKFEIFRQLEEAFVTSYSDEETAAASARILAELDELIELRRREPKEDLTSRLLEARLNGQALTAEQLKSISFLLFLAGLDTVMNVMSFGCQYAARSPAIQQRIAADPAAVEAFAEEVIRLFGTLTAVRIVSNDVAYGGALFKAGDMVLCMLPLAGWDPRRNSDSSSFDFDRKTRSHLTFSTGSHMCLGQFLARAEVRILFAEWFKRIPSFSTAGETVPAVRTGSTFQLLTLPLRWDPARVQPRSALQ
jgi:cytochrome P450